MRLLAISFGLLSRARKNLYKLGILRQIKVNVPVIVVGNINVGGTGKTPVTLWLAGILQKQGKLWVSSQGAMEVTYPEKNLFF